MTHFIYMLCLAYCSHAKGIVINCFFFFMYIYRLKDNIICLETRTETTESYCITMVFTFLKFCHALYFCIFLHVMCFQLSVFKTFCPSNTQVVKLLLGTKHSIMSFEHLHRFIAELFPPESSLLSKELKKSQSREELNSKLRLNFCQEFITRILSNFLDFVLSKVKKC